MNEVLKRMPLHELRSIALALRARRLPSPLSSASLGRYVGRSAEAAIPFLVRLSAEGLANEHLAFFLEAIAAERESVNETDVELVSTGPDVVGYPSRDTRIVVRDLFSRAGSSVLIAGYAVYQGEDVFRTLAERMDENVQLHVEMFLDVQRRRSDTSPSSEILRVFADRFRRREWPGLRLPEVYYDPRSLEMESTKRTSMHAKCVVVDDSEAFVSSANFTEAAQVRNLEVGVLLHVPAFAGQLANHFRTLAEQNVLERLPGL